jgi:hypothetical protein
MKMSKELLGAYWTSAVDQYLFIIEMLSRSIVHLGKAEATESFDLVSSGYDDL